MASSWSPVLQDAQSYHPTAFRTLVLGLEDSDTQSLFDVLPDALDFIDEGMEEGQVFVHCNSGLSRCVLCLSWCCRAHATCRTSHGAHPSIHPPRTCIA
jgi:protein-tyrosine phosphatase